MNENNFNVATICWSIVVGLFVMGLWSTITIYNKVYWAELARQGYVQYNGPKDGFCK